MSWMDARFQAHHFWTYDATAYDLTGATAVIATYRVPFPKIEVIRFSLHATAAFGNSSTMTTKPVVKLRKTPIGGSIADLNTVALISPDYSQGANVAVTADCDANQSTTPVRDVASYPTLVIGDLLSLSLTTSGVGGTQTANFTIVFREVEA